MRLIPSLASSSSSLVLGNTATSNTPISSDRSSVQKMNGQRNTSLGFLGWKWSRVLLCVLLAEQRTVAIAENRYDAIVVGGGGSGCPLAQTLAENQKHVLLLERGTLKPENSNQKENAFDGLVDNPCIEVFDGDGVVLATGNCLGGATTFNQGVWIEDVPDFFSDLGSLFSQDAITEAYTYVRNIVAPVTQSPPGSNEQIYKDELIRAFSETTLTPVANITPGTPGLQFDGIWRTHSIFDSETGQRKSADTLLDRTNPYLHLKLDTDVQRVLFDGSKASCVEAIKDGQHKTYCIKNSGRIYLTAGAIHTPRLLVESGVGPEGEKVDNEWVGKGFSDKPFLFLSSFFQPEFGGTKTLIEIAATKTAYLSSGNTRLTLFEDVSADKIGDLVDLARFERVLLPRSLRFSMLASALDVVLGLCNNQLVNNGFFSFLCFPLRSFYEEGCTARGNGFAVSVADPSSTGEVRVNFDGSVSIDPGYLSTDDDVEAIGAGIRVSAPVFEARTGPSAVAKAGDTCPDTFALMQSLITCTTFNFGYCGYPSTPYGPTWVDSDLGKLTDIQLGERAKPWLISPHHFAGTAAIGKVVDENLKVMGVDRLYVADTSVLPTTPRVNTMATAMMLGRLAGLAFAK